MSDYKLINLFSGCLLRNSLHYASLKLEMLEADLMVNWKRIPHVYNTIKKTKFNRVCSSIVLF